MQPNNHVHPTFAGILNSFAATPKACPPCNQDRNQGRTCPERLIDCRVTVKTGDDEVNYFGMFKSTCDAQLDAMDRFPYARRIDVRVLP